MKSREYLYLLYAGGVSCGKSLLQIGIIHQMAMDYPGTVYAIVRKNLSTLKRTSIPTFTKVVELNGDEIACRLNRAEHIVEYQNGSKIMFLEADMTKDPDLNKIKGIELTMALIEEANELEEQVFSILKTRVGRWRNKELNIRPVIMLNCNPARGWLKDQFYDAYCDGILPKNHYYLQALPTDNPHNTQDYLDALDTLPYAEKQRYVHCNWDYADDPDQMIEFSWVKAALSDDTFSGVLTESKSKLERFMGVDVARYGDDSTVLCLGIGPRLLKFEEYKKYSTTQVAEIVKQRIDEYDIPPINVAIDVVGLGAGTYDSLRDKGVRVSAFCAGEKPTEKPNEFFAFKNMRAQAFWELREAIRLGDITLVNDKRFITEAVSVKYKIDEKIIAIEAKDSYKARIRKSPDFLDAAVIANYARMNSLRARISLDSVIIGKKVDNYAAPSRGRFLTESF